MADKFLFELGQTLKDKITGFTGIVRARTQYLTGCNVYALQSRDLKDGKPAEWSHFDEHLLELDETVEVLDPYKKKETAKPIRRAGGPQPAPQQKTS